MCINQHLIFFSYLNFDVFRSAGIKQATRMGMTVDPDIIILEPTAPSTPVYYNSGMTSPSRSFFFSTPSHCVLDAWSGGSRCNADGPAFFSAPIPLNLVIPGMFQDLLQPLFLFTFHVFYKILIL